MKSVRNSIIAIMAIGLSFAINSCSTVDLYEKTVSIPGHAWENSYRPSFTFEIKDTTAFYEPYFIIRHTDKYNFNNIWVDISVKMPGNDSLVRFRADIELGRNDTGWLGTGMDDIYEHRAKMRDDFIRNNISLRKLGTYTFTFEQIMRENPLGHVMNVGLRLQKK